MQENVAGAGIDTGESLADADALFEQFLARNPHSKIGLDRTSQKAITSPWGDQSVIILLPQEREELTKLASALNKVLLPERLTAVWHSDTKVLEVIWTAFTLAPSQREIVGRTFDFSFKRKTHKCSFAQSSDRLLLIAKHTSPNGMTTTNHRNMISFHHYTQENQDEQIKRALDVPRSFFITSVEWSENKVIELISHLNFLLTYYDDSSPFVLLHNVEQQNNIVTKKTRYIENSFPKRISVGPLNGNLLSFWAATRGNEPVMKFILCYRIIEFASHHYVEESVKLQIRKMLSRPNIADQAEKAIEELLDLVGAGKRDDVQKFRGLVAKCVRPELIWREAQANKAFFIKETKFEGGFSVRPLLNGDEPESAFCKKGLGEFCDLLRRIRNALSHGRDQDTNGLISATTKNFHTLLPWVHLIGTAAGEVVLYNKLP